MRGRPPSELPRLIHVIPIGLAARRRSPAPHTWHSSQSGATRVCSPITGPRTKVRCLSDPFSDHRRSETGFLVKKKRYRRKIKSTALDRRQRKGKKLLSPFARVQGLVNWQSWANDRLPNILWACVLAGSLDRDHYLTLFRQIAISARSALEDEDHASLCQNFLSTLNQDVFDLVFSPLTSDGDAAPLVQCLALIDGLPDLEHWRRLFPDTAPSAELWDRLARGVFFCIDHQSQEATDVRWLKLVFLAISGKLLLPGVLIRPAKTILSSNCISILTMATCAR